MMRQRARMVSVLGEHWQCSQSVAMDQKTFETAANCGIRKSVPNDCPRDYIFQIPK